MEIWINNAENNTNLSVTLTSTDSNMISSLLNTSLIYNLTILKKLELERYLARNIPITIYLVILCVVGSIGNLHAFLVYFLRYKRSNHRTFVLWLAFVDLLACAFGIPFEIVDTRYNYTFDSSGACKLFRLLNHFVSSCSGGLLAVIAVERYMKACRPMGRQFSLKESKWACFGVVVLCILMAIPSVIFYGLNEEIVDKELGLVGTDCTALSSYRRTSFYKVYNILLLFLCTAVFIVCVILYTAVGRVLYRQVRFRRASQTKNPKQRLTSMSSSDGEGTLSKKKTPENCGFCEDESSVGNQSNSGLSRVPSPVSPTTSFRIKFPQALKKKRLFDRSKQITFMFLVTTAVSYIGYLPFLILVLIQAINKRSYAKISMTLGPFNSILMRGYFLNNCTNPVVYSFMDERFRRECRTLYRRGWRKFRFFLLCRLGR